MYLAQSFFHSLTAALIVGGALRAWKIGDPSVRQRFGMLVVLFPLFSFPAYQLLNPARSSLSFRLGALFDSARWMGLELPGGVPLGIFFVLMLVVTSLVFSFQELAPVLRHTVEQADYPEAGEARPGEEDAALKRVMDSLGSETPVRVLDDPDMVLFSTTGGEPAVYISSGLMGSTGEGELRAAIAHELAHIKRSRRPLLVALFVLRVLMFFNPVVLVSFRRIVQQEEKICDDEAVRMTDDAGALLSVLRKFRAAKEDPPPEGRRLSGLRASLEQYSHDLLLDARIERLELNPRPSREGHWAAFAATVAAVSVVNYFVV
ncbi:MAG: hypothetical protein Kow0025_02790 [Thermodesulfovibrionales bacterium]